MAGGATVTYGYDAQDRIISISRPGLGTWQVIDGPDSGDDPDFNEDSQPETVRLPSGETVTIAYDDAGRIDMRNVDNGETADFTYNAGDGIETIVDNTGTTTYTYYDDTNNRQEAAPGPSHTGKLQKILYPNGASVTYKYDVLGRVRTLITKPDDGQSTEYLTTYEYDALGNVWKVWDPFNPEGQPGSNATVYSYDELGRLKTRTLPNGVFTEWDFDNRDRMTKIAHYETSAKVNMITSFEYLHPIDAVGEPHKITREDGSYVELDYDAALRLEEERYYDSSDVLQKTITYTYDAAGNRTSRTEDTSTDTYNINSESGYELDSISGANPATFGYDTGGRLTTIDRASLDATLAYNAAGQITSVDNTTGDDYQYVYDALGRRTVAKTNDVVDRKFLIAPAAQRLGAGVLDVEVQHLATNGAGGLLQGWVYAGENPILRYDNAGNVEYYLESANDSIAAIIDNGVNPTVVAAYEFDGFGNVLNGVDPTSNAGGDFGFHAAWRDDATGLYHMRARTYDPETGRFLTPDPAEPNPQAPESYNPYTFANNNPHLFSDPTGLFSVTEISVSNNIQSNLGRLKTVVVQQARQHAKEEIQEFAVDFFVSKLEQLLPMFGGGNPGPFFNTLGASGVGNLFQDTVNEVFKKVLPFEGFWIEPAVAADDGEALDGGIIGGINPKNLFPPQPRPDYIVNPDNPSNSDADRSWLIGDITLSGNRLYKKYVGTGAKQNNQWNAITNHARNYGFNISLFITFYQGGPHVEPALRAKIGKTALENGAFVFIINLKD